MIKVIRSRNAHCCALSHFTATKPRCATDTFIEELLLEEGILTRGKTWIRGLETNLLEDFTISDGEKAPIQFYVYLPWAVGEHAS